MVHQEEVVPHGEQVAGRAQLLRELSGQIGPKYADRNGGYTRMLKMGPRRGDAEMAVIQLV